MTSKTSPIWDSLLPCKDTWITLTKAKWTTWRIISWKPSTCLSTRWIQVRTLWWIMHQISACFSTFPESVWAWTQRSFTWTSLSMLYTTWWSISWFATGTWSLRISWLTKILTSSWRTLDSVPKLCLKTNRNRKTYLMDFKIWMETNKV